MVQADGQVILVEFPDRLKHQLGLGAGVDKHDRHFGPPHGGEHHLRRRQAHMARPRNAPLRQHHGDFRRRAILRLYERRPRPNERPHRIRVRHRRRKAHAAGDRRQRRNARQAQRQLLAPLGARQRVDFVDDNAAQKAEKLEGTFVREK